jgi:hypothetical protein
MNERILGVRVKSGWAAVVLLGGSARAPLLLDSSRVELADPKTPASLQPYHAGTGTAQTDQRAIERLIALVERCAERNLGVLIRRYRTAGQLPTRAAVVGTSSIDPTKITNPHIRIHALEGQLFRRVAREALTACGLPCTTVLEKELAANAPRSLVRPSATIRREVKLLGASATGPWRSEQKSAALAAWVLLTTTTQP